MPEMKCCTKCGEEKPATLDFFAAERRRPSGLFCWCRECQRADAKARRDAKPESSRQQARDAYYRNHEKRKAALREAYRKRMADPESAAKERERTRLKAQKEREQNPESVRARVRASRERNLDKVRERNRQKGKAAYAANPEIFRARTARARAKRRSAGGEYTGNDLLAAFKRQNGCCYYCGKKVGRSRGPWHADHFIPISRGGTNDPENIVIACEPCNRSKYNFLPWEWMPDRFSPPHQHATD